MYVVFEFELSMVEWSSNRKVTPPPWQYLYESVVCYLNNQSVINDIDDKNPHFVWVTPPLKGTPVASSAFPPPRIFFLRSFSKDPMNIFIRWAHDFPWPEGRTGNEDRSGRTRIDDFFTHLSHSAPPRGSGALALWPSNR